MRTTIDAIITDILRAEGWDTYTNHPADRGGPTKWGITLKAYQDFVPRTVITEEDIKALTETHARAFYRQMYICVPKFDQLPAGLIDLVVDCGVNSGVRIATKWLQRAVGARQDGALGPKTLALVAQVPVEAIVLRVLAYRFKLWGRLVSSDPKLSAAKDEGFRLQAEFAAGWNNRGAGFLLEWADAIVTKLDRQ